MQQLEDSLSNSNTRKAVIALVLIGIGFFAISQGFNLKLSITPGFQGMQNGFYGYTPNGKTVSVIGSALQTPPGACGYSYQGSPTISTMYIRAETPNLFGITCAFPLTDGMVADAQTSPVIYTDPFFQPVKVNYFVQVPGTSNWQHVQGQVNVYTFTNDYSIQSGSSGRWTFTGDTIWYNLANTNWNQAVLHPKYGNVTGNVFETPLFGIVTNVEWRNQGSSQLSVGVVGQTLQFYTSPDAAGQTLKTLSNGQSPSAQLNSSLSSTFAPDSRMQRLVYYPISIQSLSSDCPLVAGSCSYPSAKITIKLYTLQIGEYILTNPEKLALQGRSQTCTGTGCAFEFLNGIGAWLSQNPFLAGLIGLFGIGTVIFIILAVFATPLIVAIIWVIARRKET